MKRATVLLVFVMALAWSSSSAVQAQALQEGTWSGTGTQPNGNTQTFSIEVTRIPDPHWRWRPSRGKLLIATVVRPQGRTTLSDIRLDGETLSYTGRFTGSGDVRCVLNLQPDGEYQGQCVLGGGARQLVTWTPPTDSSPSPPDPQ